MSRKPPTIDDVTLAEEGQDVHTFSNGTEWDLWSCRNCAECRWFHPTDMGKDCAFEAAAFMHALTPEVATLFGWIHDAEAEAEDGIRSAFDAPEQCAFFTDKDNDGDAPPRLPPFVDPTQLTFLAPDEWPAEVKAPRKQRAAVAR